jgi:hypothetical protein
MADMVISVDGDTSAVDRKLEKTKQKAQQAGKAFGQAQSQASRVGGAGGGAVGRAIGGFQQGMGAGFLGLGLAAGGAVIAGAMQRDREGVDAARAQVQTLQSQRARERQAQTSNERLAAGGARYSGVMRRAGFRGDTQGTLKGYTDMATSWGLTTGQGLDIYEASNETKGVDPNDIAKGLASGVLGDNAAQVAQAIKKSGGLVNAVAKSQKISKKQAEYGLEQMRGNNLSLEAGNIDIAGNSVAESQLKSAISGESSRVLRQDANETLNPLIKLNADAARAALDTMEQLTAAAKAQGTMAALLQEAGRVIGMGEGSESRKVGNFARGQALPEP